MPLIIPKGQRTIATYQLVRSIQNKRFNLLDSSPSSRVVFPLISTSSNILPLQSFSLKLSLAILKSPTKLSCKGDVFLFSRTNAQSTTTIWPYHFLPTNKVELPFLN
ncbi:hypothetical protein ACB098_02G138500 [Castanea mollissima]